MENIYELRQNKKHYKVISSTYSYGANCENMVLVCHLFYLDTLEFYLEYLKKLCGNIDLVIISSSAEVIGKSKSFLWENYRIKYLLKDNRGRDVSALLVAAKDIIRKYEYIGFIHDKKSHEEKLEEDVNLWIKNLWDNTVCSNEYICNIKGLFDTEPNVGLLIPPEPFGEYFHDWEYSQWDIDCFEEELKLLKLLKIEAGVKKDIPPIALGTVFWGRRTALEKLLDYPWDYTDFPEEPMADEGTISHAIERILPYVSQDAGYDVYTILADDFIPELLSHAQKYSFLSYGLLSKTYGLRSVHEMEYALIFENHLKELVDENTEIFLYGAGQEGQYCLNYMRNIGINPVGFVVSEKDNRKVSSIDCFAFSEVESRLKTGVVVITPYSGRVKEEISEILLKHNINNYLCWRG